MPGYPPTSEPPLHRSHRRRRNSGLVALAVALGVLGVLALSGTLFATTVLRPVTQDKVNDRHTAVPVPDGSASPAPSASASVAAPSLSPSPAAPSPTPRAAPPKLTGTAAFEADVLTLVNQQRAAAGCRPVTADSRLTAAARGHSRDMAVNNYFDHTTPSGVTFDKRITAAGYRWSSAGENIAAGQPTPAAVMTAWMNSPGHRANILNCGYRNLGVGLAYNSRHVPYWTQDFAAPL